MLTDGILLLKREFATEYFSKLDHYTSPSNVGKIDDFFKQHFESKIAAAKDIYSFDGVDAHIKIQGPMSPDGPDLYDIFYGYGGVSFADIVDAVELAAEEVDPKTGSVFFNFNCPGSTVDGVDSTFQSIAALSETHNTVAVNHGMIASGAMWLASACGSIVSTSPVAFTGSIGVVVAGYDISEMLENMGVKKVVITNHEATEKRADISTTEGQKIIQAELDAIYGVFKSRVLQGRKKMTAESIDSLKGSVKVASEALEIGLIDSVSGIQQPPASAGKTQRVEAKMDLTALLAANPEAQAQYDANIKAHGETQFAAGETAGTEKGKAEGIAQAKAVSDVVTPIISSAHYPDAVKTRVIEKAQAGDVEAVKDYVSMYDMTSEGIATANAIKEQDDETPPVAPKKIEKQGEEGLISSPEDVTAAAKAIKEG